MKRKRSEAAPQQAKVARHWDPLSPDNSDSEDGTFSPAPDQAEEEDEEEEEGEEEEGGDWAGIQETTPPFTPLTKSSSSHFGNKPPSEQKTHHCTHAGCEKSFNRPARLAEHLRSHGNERIFRCGREGCAKDFLRRSHLRHHVQSAHEDARPYACLVDSCGKSFVTNTRLKRHLAAVHDGRNRFRCNEYAPCQEVFRKHATLQRHILAVHLNRKPFTCTHMDPAASTLCAEAFDTAAQLRKHQGRAHGGLRFWCSECNSEPAADPNARMTLDGIQPSQESGTIAGTGFETYALLQAHLRAVHPPTCIFCSHACGSQRELRHHVEMHHSGSSVSDRRTQVCDVPGCDRAFTKAYNLSLHKRTVHEGEKRFVCGATDLSTSKKVTGWSGHDGCGRPFQTKGNLEEHVRTQHLRLPGARRPRKAPSSFPTNNNNNHDNNSAAPPVLSTATRLTGAGYAEESGRDLPCFFSPACAYRFTRAHDRTVHLEKHHGLTDDDDYDDIEYALMESEALSGGRFWTGADDDDNAFYGDRDEEDHVLSS